MKWTTWLSKMYCVMICSNVCLQLETLKHKRKPWVQPHQWEKCSVTWWRKQQTQYKQHQNLHKIKVAEVEWCLHKVWRKGCMAGGTGVASLA
ncbi:hypothetical protein SUZIE_129950 [Sciurus carolinensis]|uniref:Secreted protein n=1 Tax=Sciurus carolinensis TaxID=30640 RepID=A0AA41MMR6_SCICA|nr:hypothetical protein [Sciurus carolinensis]